MTDREFINNLIKIYFSHAKDPHQATIDNAFTNRLNDIANKVENQEKALKVFFEKYVDVELLNVVNTVDDYNRIYGSTNRDYGNNLTEDEFNLLKRWPNGERI